MFSTATYYMHNATLLVTAGDDVVIWASGAPARPTCRLVHLMGANFDGARQAYMQTQRILCGSKGRKSNGVDTKTGGL